MLISLPRLLLLLLPALGMLALQTKPALDLGQARRASFRELNQVRQNPALYATKYRTLALATLSKKAPLTWDTTLARLAQRKAEDMARRNYFAHQDQRNKGMNYYLWQAGYPLPARYSKGDQANEVESIACDTEGPTNFIQQLIVDEGIPSLGHRKHLLGLNDYSGLPATQVGIGIAYDARSRYKYYCCILIAPRR